MVDEINQPGETGKQLDLMVMPASALAARKNSNKRGHAAVPGTGPSGETCKTCDHLVRKIMGGTYLKCGLVEAYWTGGSATDVRAGDAACRQWKANRGD